MRSWKFVDLDNISQTAWTIPFVLQCYGAEDDKTFGIPGEVTTHHYLCINYTCCVDQSVSPPIHQSIHQWYMSNQDSVLSSYFILNSFDMHHFDNSFIAYLIACGGDPRAPSQTVLKLDCMQSISFLHL